MPASARMTALFSPGVELLRARFASVRQASKYVRRRGGKQTGEAAGAKVLDVFCLLRWFAGVLTALIRLPFCPAAEHIRSCRVSAGFRWVRSAQQTAERGGAGQLISPARAGRLISVLAFCGKAKHPGGSGKTAGYKMGGGI